jgi:hypothetical protein
MLSTTDLIARRAIALQKRQEDLAQLRERVYAERNRLALRFEREHAAIIREFNFKRGDLVLVRNTAIEKALNRKMRPRYFGPMIVVSRNRGSAYILCDMDGALFHAPVAAFRVIPYFPRRELSIPDLEDHIDVSVARLREMERSRQADPDDPDDAEQAIRDAAADYSNDDDDRDERVSISQ